jgi:DNA replication and repair protein RecF
MSGQAPIALMDEIAAHFDPRRREALFAALARIGGQAFLTGADPAAFASLAGGTYEVASGKVMPGA